jgi:hypothetical protein
MSRHPPELPSVSEETRRVREPSSPMTTCTGASVTHVGRSMTISSGPSGVHRTAPLS